MVCYGASLDWFDDNGMPLFEKDDSNLDRGSEQNTEDLVDSIVKKGHAQGVRGTPKLRANPATPNGYKLIGYGHFCVAVYRAVERYPDNQYVQAQY